MVSVFGRALLVATSLAPILGAFAIQRLSHVGGWKAMGDKWFWLWTVAGAVLVLATYGFLVWCQRHLQSIPVETESVTLTDKDVLAFLLAYLLPLLGKDTLVFDDPWVSIYVYGLIFVAVFHSSSYHFNPMLSIFGWHFYDIELAGGYSALLVSRACHTTQQNRIVIVKLTDFLLLEISSPKETLLS